MKSLKNILSVFPWFVLFGLGIVLYLQKDDVEFSMAAMPVDTLRLDSFTNYEGGLGGSWRDCVLFSGSFALRGAVPEGVADSGWVQGDKAMILKIFPQLNSPTQNKSKVLMDFLSADNFHLLIVPGRTIAVLNQSGDGLLVFKNSTIR